MGDERLVLKRNSDNTITVRNFKNVVSDALQTGATVTMDVLDSDSMAVSMAGNPISLTEVAGRSGLYRGTIPNAAVLVLGDEGTIEVTATASDTSVLFMVIDYVVENASG